MSDGRGYEYTEADVKGIKSREYQTGVNVEKIDHEKAKKLALESEKEGSVFGKFEMAAFSLIEKQDAEPLFTEVAKHQHILEATPHGQFILGKLYEQGYGGVTRDVSKARQYFEKGARLGDPSSQFNLAMYYQGEKNYVRANALFEEASKSGHAYALFQLGINYHNGRGFTSPDKEKAVEFYTRAAGKDLEKAIQLLKYLPK